MTNTIRNINSDFGDTVTFSSVEEMAAAVISRGYELPDDGLVEGRDYSYLADEVVLEGDTHCAVYEDNGYTVFARNGGGLARIGRIHAAPSQFTLTEMVFMIEHGD